MEVKIRDRGIGEGNPVFIVAEVGTNHNGRVDLALEMVDRAAEIGADAVKFQPVDPRASYIEGSEPFQIYSRVWLGMEEWVRIRERAEKNGLVFFAAPADIPGSIGRPAKQGWQIRRDGDKADPGTTGKGG